MPDDEHARAVWLALLVADELGQLFAWMGTTQFPNGHIFGAYRNARRALASQLRNVESVREILAQLRRELELAARHVVERAAPAGSERAIKELDLYGLQVKRDEDEYDKRVRLVILAWMASMDAQLNQVLGMVNAGIADEAIIVGDAERTGLLSPIPIVRDGARWAATMAEKAYAIGVERSLQDPHRFCKQAVAVLDSRTTKCCIEVHGQVVGLDEPFHLTAEPHFAEYMDASPFHWWCRTQTILVLRSQADDDLIRQMRRDAQDQPAAGDGA